MAASSDSGLTPTLLLDAVEARDRIAAGRPHLGDDQLMHRFRHASTVLVARNVTTMVGWKNRDDVLSEFCLRVYRGLPGLRQGREDLEACKGWLRAVAHAACVDFVKRKLQDFEVSGPGYELDVEDTLGDDLRMQSAELIDLRNLLEQSVNRLPRIFREVFVLRDVLDLSTAEVSEMLGVNERTVATRLRRARIRLSIVPGMARHAAGFGLTRREGSA